ncbi:MAG: ATP-binding protein [Clostridiales bacterium]|mgnify:CR=1 FL=1|nr:ATP-binding protein [Clostridiales bacterium]
MKLQFVGYSCFDEVNRIIDELMSSIPQDIKRKYEDAFFCIVVALRELLNNAVEHGNKMDAEKKIICEFSLEGNILSLVVIDQGQGFHITEVLDKVVQTCHDRERFRGISMVTSLGFFIEVVGNQVIAKLDMTKL